MKMVIRDPVVDPRVIDRAVNDLVASSHRDDFKEIGHWMVRAGLGEKGARERLIKEVSARVSKEMSHGLVQVTIEELDGETAITAKMEKSLPAMYPRIDFVVKSGAFDLWTVTYWFRVTSTVRLDNLVVRVNQHEIVGIQSGNLQAFVTLAYCGHDQKNPSPFTLFKDTKVIDMDLAEAVGFE